MPTSTRFMGMLNRPSDPERREPTASPLDELDESDVVWSSSIAIVTSAKETASSEAAVSEPHPSTPQSAASSPFSAASSTSPRQFLAPTASAGLSTAIGFSDRMSRSPVVHRKKTAMSPLLSPAGAAAVYTVMAPPSPGTSPISRSAPVKVPIWTDSRWIGKGGRGFDPMAGMGRFEEEGEEEEEGSEDGEMVPPHEIVARSHQTTTFSVFEGVGRTLKGRDLTRVRNAVMQKTGFLE